MRRPRKRLAILALTIGLALIGWAGQEFNWFTQPPGVLGQSQPGLYDVVRFSDGDTIVVNMNGTEEIIRMIGVDTPETHHPDLPVQCYGPAAAAFTKNLIGTQKVRLEADPTNQNRDRYGRLLRYVYLPGGTLVQNEIISQGYGFAYTFFPFTKKDEFVLSENTAKAENRGLWGNCSVITEANGQVRTNPAP